MTKTPPTPPPKGTPQAMLGCGPSRALPACTKAAQTLAVATCRNHLLVDNRTSTLIF